MTALSKFPVNPKGCRYGFPGKGHYPAVAMDLVRQVKLLDETLFI
jgi:hypothetical protein